MTLSNDKSTPQISVILAVYNGEDLLREAIDSILNQTFTNFELIIVNDGSTDRTPEIISSYEDERIVALNNEPNLGLPKSLNKAIRFSQGDFIAINDHDDISDQKRLERQLECILKNPELSLVATSAMIIDEAGRKIGFKAMPSTESQTRLEFLFNNPVIHSSVLMNKEVALKLGCYDESLIPGCDYELWSRMIRSGYKITFLKEPLIYFRVVGGSLTESKRANIDKYIKELAIIVRKNISSFINMDLSEEEVEGLCKILNCPHTLNLKELENATHLFNLILNRFPEEVSELNREKELKKTIAKFKYLLAIANIEKNVLSTARKELIESIRLYPYRIKPVIYYLLTFLGYRSIKFTRMLKGKN